MKYFLSLFMLVSSITFASDIYTGSYQVPLSNVDFEEFAANPVKNIRFNVNSLTFELPAAIASDEALNVKFSRSDDESNIFHSAFGQAECLQSSQKQVKCEVKYNSVYASFLKSKLRDTENFLERQNFPEEELSARIDIAHAFSGNPIGFLFINLY